MPARIKVAAKRARYLDGILFDSKAEKQRYAELKLMERAGEISGLALQPKFTLQEAYRNNHGKLHRAITYSADFQYEESGRVVIEDVKGLETEVFKIKRKLFEKRYPEYDFRLVKVKSWRRRR